jgi:hypothetical protein
LKSYQTPTEKDLAMSKTQETSSDPALRNLDGLLPRLEALYKDVYSHPELSMQETRTAGLAADSLRAGGYEVTKGVGKTGVVGLLRNGDGPIVMLRADMDALPVDEATGLPYASKTTVSDQEGRTVPVSHMCGHDMHVTWLAGATKLLAEARAAIDLTPHWLRKIVGLTDHGLNALEAGLVRQIGAFADRLVLESHPAVQACRRMGLSANYLYSR